MFGVVKSLFGFVLGFHVFHVFLELSVLCLKNIVVLGDVPQGDKLASMRWSLVGSCL